MEESQQNDHEEATCTIKSADEYLLETVKDFNLESDCCQQMQE